MVLCSLHCAILLLYQNKDRNDEAFQPVSSVQSICRIEVTTKLVKYILRYILNRQVHG